MYTETISYRNFIGESGSNVTTSQTKILMYNEPEHVRFRQQLYLERNNEKDE